MEYIGTRSHSGASQPQRQVSFPSAANMGDLEDAVDLHDHVSFFKPTAKADVADLG